MFSAILGHERTLSLLTRAMTGDRLAHAYLFTGPEGVGKALVARAMAAALICRNRSGPAAPPCGACPDCRQFVSGNHPDFIEISPDGATIRIDRVRDLRRQLAFSPFGGGLRIVLMNEAQTMRREAANSLLKILEEPPPDNLFLLVAADSEPLLPTIVSRCQQVQFAPLPDGTAAAVIRQRNPELDPDRALLLARLSGGRPGLALSLEAGEVLAVHQRVREFLADPPASRPYRVEQGLALARDMAALGDQLGLLLDLLRLSIRDRLLGTPEPGTPVNNGTDTGNPVAGPREGWNLSRLSDKMRAIDTAAADLAANCNRDLVCEVLILELTA